MSEMLICQLTDLHVRPQGLAASRVSETNMLTERAFRVAAGFSPLPDVAIITGDLTECGLEAEYANLSTILGRTLSMPVYVIPGNHDRRDNLRAGLAHLPGVTTDPEYDGYPLFSRDGTHIVFEHETNGISHLQVMDSDGKNQRPLTDGPTFDFGASFSLREPVTTAIRKQARTLQDFFI